MTKDGVILLIGVLPDQRSAENVVDPTTAVKSSWIGPSGDITNPYVGGWNIYKIQGITGTTVFPETAGGSTPTSGKN